MDFAKHLPSFSKSGVFVDSEQSVDFCEPDLGDSV